MCLCLCIYLHIYFFLSLSSIPLSTMCVCERICVLMQNSKIIFGSTRVVDTVTSSLHLTAFFFTHMNFNTHIFEFESLQVSTHTHIHSSSWHFPLPFFLFPLNCFLLYMCPSVSSVRLFWSSRNGIPAFSSDSLSHSYGYVCVCAQSLLRLP